MPPEERGAGDVPPDRPPLSVPLTGLTGDRRAIWSDADIRRAAFEELVHAAATGGDRLARALARIDDAVVEGLE